LGGKKSRKDAFQRTKKQGGSGAPRWQLIAALAAILAVYVAMRLPGIGVPLDRDEGVFGYMGQLINAGKLPYREAVDHKPPVAFYINALALRFTPPTERGIHFFLLFYNFLSLVCVFYIGKTWFRSLSAGLWCAFTYSIFSAAPTIQGFTASTEMWMLLPISLSLLLAVLGVRKNSFVLLLLSGIAGAAACWTKQSACTSILFVFIFVGAAAFYRAGDSQSFHGSTLIRMLSSWLFGTLLFSSILMLYFFFKGAFQEFLYWSFQHNLSYAGNRALSESLGMVQSQLIEIFRADFLLISVGVIAAAWLTIKKRAEGYFISGFLLLSLLGTIPGFAYNHYFAQLVPAMAIASGYGFCILIGQCQTVNGRLAAVIACGLLLVAIPAGMNSQYFFAGDPREFSRLFFGSNPFPESKPLADFIESSTAPTDKIFIMGSEPQIIFYAGRRSATSFPMLYPLMSSFPRYKEFQATVWRELQKDPPKYVLQIINIPATFQWDGKAVLDGVNRIGQWFRRDYVFERAMIVKGLQGEWQTDANSKISPNIPYILVFKRKL
jgi:hypothetical protein